MRQGRVLEMIAQTNAAIDRAVEYLGTHEASAAELTAIERVQTARQAGSSEDVLVALVEAGYLQRCPSAFWREVERAAAIVLPLHSPIIGPVERARREQFHGWLERRGSADVEPVRVSSNGNS